MKFLREGCFFGVVIAAGMLLSFGCGGSGGTPAVTPVSINTLDGQTNIPIDSTFQYAFSKAVSTTTVTAGNFFIVPAPAPAANVIKATFDPTVCNAASAIAATITCSTTAACDLDPTADLQPGARYAACLSTDIKYGTGESFEGFMATFTTAGGTPVTVSAKLVRLDGTELNLTDRPIPRAVKVKYIPSVPLTAAADQQVFQTAVALDDAAGTAVAGTYAWAADGTSALFTPTARLKYKTTYTIEATTALPAAIAIKAATTIGSFTTLTKHDINGDGFPDVIVGASGDPTAAAIGKVYVFYGTATGIAPCDLSAANCAGATLTTGVASDNFGYSVIFAGDVNGDGYEDFIVGAPVFSGAAKGTAYVLAGGAGLTGAITVSPSTALATITRAAAGKDALGISVSGAGDMNGDGFDDVIVGAPAVDATPAKSGQAFIFLGGSALSGTLDVASANQVITGQANDIMAAVVSWAGDVNGDGKDDVIVSATTGRAYVFYGAATLAATRDAAAADATLSGTAPFGFQVAGAGDVDHDGKGDVLVGKLLGSHGQVYVFRGPQLAGTVNAADAFSIITAVSDDFFGVTVSSAGDVDGDGMDDLLLGGYFSDTGWGGADFGYAYVFLGKNLKPTLSELNADATIIGALQGDVLGSFVAAAGDLNGDGIDDILVGAPEINFKGGVSAPHNGHAYIFYGVHTTGVASCDMRTPPASCTAPVTLTGADKDGFGILRTLGLY